MTYRYVDPAASGLNNGGVDDSDPTTAGNWTNAWTDFQSALTNATAGDVVYCRGIQTLEASMVPAASGTASAFIMFIGCAADGSVDGTQFELDGDGSYIPLSITTARTYLWFENFTFKNSSTDGVDAASGSDYHMYVNCKFHTNTDNGVDGSMDYIYFVRCESYDNGGGGFVVSYGPKFIFTLSYDNDSYGYYCSSYGIFYGSISHNNTTAGARAYTHSCAINSIFDTETIGFLVGSDNMTFLCNRITNNTTGIDFSDELTFLGWNVIVDNTADYANPAALYTRLSPGSVVGGWAMPLTSDTDTNEIDPDGATVDGYNGAKDFSLTASKTYNGDGTDVVDMTFTS